MPQYQCRPGSRSVRDQVPLNLALRRRSLTVVDDSSASSTFENGTIAPILESKGDAPEFRCVPVENIPTGPNGTSTLVKLTTSRGSGGSSKRSYVRAPKSPKTSRTGWSVLSSSKYNKKEKKGGVVGSSSSSSASRRIPTPLFDRFSDKDAMEAPPPPKMKKSSTRDPHTVTSSSDVQADLQSQSRLHQSPH